MVRSSTNDNITIRLPPTVTTLVAAARRPSVPVHNHRDAAVSAPTSAEVAFGCSSRDVAIAAPLSLLCFSTKVGHQSSLNIDDACDVLSWWPVTNDDEIEFTSSRADDRVDEKFQKEHARKKRCRGYRTIRELANSRGDILSKCDEQSGFMPIALNVIVKLCAVRKLDQFAS